MKAKFFQDGHGISKGVKEGMCHRPLKMVCGLHAHTDAFIQKVSSIAVFCEMPGAYKPKIL